MSDLTLWVARDGRPSEWTGWLWLGEGKPFLRVTDAGNWDFPGDSMHIEDDTLFPDLLPGQCRKVTPTLDTEEI